MANKGFRLGNSLYPLTVRNGVLDKLTTGRFFVHIYLKIIKTYKKPSCNKNISKLPYSIFLEKSLSSCLFFVFNYFVKLPYYF